MSFIFSAKRQEFNWACAIPPLVCADSRFAKPRNSLLGRAKNCQWQVFVRRRPPKQGELRTDVSKATMFQGEREQKHAKRAAPTGANFLLVRKFPKGRRVYSFCFCKKNQKAAGVSPCDPGSNRRSKQCFYWNDRLSSGNRLCANHYFAQYRRQWFEPLRTPSVAQTDMRLCTNSKRLLLMTVGYDGLRKGGYGGVGMGCFFR